MFKWIIDMKPNFDPVNVKLDFEQAAIRTIRTKFPHANISGCFFHLCQSVYRAVERFGLKADYSADPLLAQQIRALPALALLNTDDVIDTFEELKQQFPIQGKPVLQYFEETYIGERNREGRPQKRPQFDVKLWNIHQSTLQDGHRTNNVVEGWNNRFASLVDCAHPNIWKFLKSLKKEQSMVEAELIQAEAGVRRPKRLVTERQQKRILNILNEQSTTNLDKVTSIEKQGEYDIALAYYRLTIELSPDRFDLLVRSYKYISLVYLDIHSISYALEYQTKALEIQQKKLMTRLKLNYDRVLDYLLQVLNIYKELHMYEDISRCCDSIGEVYFRQKIKDIAINYHFETLKVIDERFPSYLPYRIVSYEFVGKIYQSMRDYEQALKYYNDALNTKLKYEPLNDPTIVESYEFIGGLFHQNQEIVSKQLKCMIRV
ncbi:unnamed protein product [Rotaria sp. Silwood1]|nr:unnamed protein product [Rotaria sp. Silwood1]